MKERRLELKIALSPSQVAPVKLWLERLMRARKEDEDAAPELESAIIRIGARDFVRLLGHVDPADSNEFDVFRLRSAGMNQLARACVVAFRKAATRN